MPMFTMTHVLGYDPYKVSLQISTWPMIHRTEYQLDSYTTRNKYENIVQKHVTLDQLHGLQTQTHSAGSHIVEGFECFVYI